MIDNTMFGNCRTEKPMRHARRISNSESNQILREKAKSAEFRKNMKPFNQ